jgi:hypothetical protein
MAWRFRIGLVKQLWVHYIVDMCSGVVSCIGSLSADAKRGDAMVHGYTNAMNVMDNSLPCFLSLPPFSLALFFIFLSMWSTCQT